MSVKVTLVVATVLGPDRGPNPLALPVAAQLVEAESIKEALSKGIFRGLPLLGELFRRDRPSPTPALYWDVDGESGMEAEQTFERRDLPLSRKRWQFDTRKEHHATLQKED